MVLVTEVLVEKNKTNKKKNHRRKKKRVKYFTTVNFDRCLPVFVNKWFSFILRCMKEQAVPLSDVKWGLDFWGFLFASSFFLWQIYSAFV